MLKLKPFWITLMAIIFFAGGMALGTTSDWWSTDGRKTPLDGEKFYESHEEEAVEATATGSIEEGTPEVEAEEEHAEEGVVSGDTTIQDALDMGIAADVLEEILEGPLEDTSATIQTVAKERGLQFGVIKDELNAMFVP